MKKLIITTLLIAMGFVCISTASAAETSDSVYRTKIEQMIAFYQARLYLIDSEYKVLSDIGEDARRRINYLQGQTEQLVQDLKDNAVESNSINIKKYLVKKMKAGDLG